MARRRKPGEEIPAAPKRPSLSVPTSLREQENPMGATRIASSLPYPVLLLLLTACEGSTQLSPETCWLPVLLQRKLHLCV